MCTSKFNKNTIQSSMKTIDLVLSTDKKATVHLNKAKSREVAYFFKDNLVLITSCPVHIKIFHESLHFSTTLCLLSMNTLHSCIHCFDKPQFHCLEILLCRIRLYKKCFVLLQHCSYCYSHLLVGLTHSTNALTLFWSVKAVERLSQQVSVRPVVDANYEIYQGF